MLASDLAYALDAALWARSLGFDPDPWQAALLRNAGSRSLLNCSRQTGKSTVTALLALHTAIYRPGALVLLLSPSLRQSSELFRKVAGYYGRISAGAPADAESTLRLDLATGSRIVSLPGSEATIRGYSGVNLLIIDEASRVPDDLYMAVRPMLAVSGGALLAMSTPWGKRGWWWQEWEHGGQGWQRVMVKASDCPRIPAAFLKEERDHLGDYWYRQEYECEFMDSQTSAFGYEHVLAATKEEVTTWEL